MNCEVIHYSAVSWVFIFQYSLYKLTINNFYTFMKSLLVTAVITHNMKRMSTGLLRAESAESKMQEEMRKAEEKIKNAKIYAILQQRK